jgi:hypothetical protein
VLQGDGAVVGSQDCSPPAALFMLSSGSQAPSPLAAASAASSAAHVCSFGTLCCCFVKRTARRDHNDVKVSRVLKSSPTRLRCFEALRRCLSGGLALLPACCSPVPVARQAVMLQCCSCGPVHLTLPASWPICLMHRRPGLQLATVHCHTCCREGAKVQHAKQPCPAASRVCGRRRPQQQPRLRLRVRRLRAVHGLLWQHRKIFCSLLVM